MRPTQYYMSGSLGYYLKFHFKLTDRIISIIGNCNKKWVELGFVPENKYDEYEFIFIGTYNFSYAKIDYSFFFIWYKNDVLRYIHKNA